MKIFEKIWLLKFFFNFLIKMIFIFILSKIKKSVKEDIKEITYIHISNGVFKGKM